MPDNVHLYLPLAVLLEIWPRMRSEVLRNCTLLYLPRRKTSIKSKCNSKRSWGKEGQWKFWLCISLCPSILIYTHIPHAGIADFQPIEICIYFVPVGTHLGVCFAEVIDLSLYLNPQNDQLKRFSQLSTNHNKSTQFTKYGIKISLLKQDVEYSIVFKHTGEPYWKDCA